MQVREAAFHPSLKKSPEEKSSGDFDWIILRLLSSYKLCGQPATVAQSAFWKMIENLQPDSVCSPGAKALVFK